MNKEHINFSTITQASSKDGQALQTVLQHYDAYIAKLCTQPMYDLEGNMHMVVNDEMKGRLHSSLLDAVTKFELYIETLKILLHLDN